MRSRWSDQLPLPSSHFTVSFFLKLDTNPPSATFSAYKWFITKSWVMERLSGGVRPLCFKIPEFHQNNS